MNYPREDAVLAHHHRYAYSAIGDRPDFRWPGERRLAFYVALNVEHYAFGEGLREELVPGSAHPDVLNYAWLDYGNRVGVWRIKEVLDQLAIPVTLLVNSEVYDHCPSVIRAFSREGHEIAAHGRTNSERPGELDEAEERALIHHVSDVIRQREGRAPAGWLGPWLSESVRTPDLLQEAGYRYLLDWCCDDQPVHFSTRSGPIVSVPYAQELNDSSTIIGRQASARDFADMIVDQFDEMLRQSDGQSLVMSIALHTSIVGQPFRLVHLRRALEHIAAQRDRLWMTRAGSIAEHFARVVPNENRLRSAG